ncbi:MAG: ATP-binding protein [Chloroflexota bacterium]|nr:ATP-binding protein [Chloroflexota bacterium]
MSIKMTTRTPTFTVDTHLFRELGALLVGRDSTALVELIKNSYDADARRVVVYGERLDDPEHGFIRVVDDGTGMSERQFIDGFLRIAARTKEAGSRRSGIFKRRFTGAKGIGRLAAHKLARLIEIESVPADSSQRPIWASIDWSLVEEKETLEELAGTNAVQVRALPANKARRDHGTTITLRRLREKWTQQQLSNFLTEVQAFKPPALLIEPLPRSIIGDRRLLFESPTIRASSNRDSGLRIDLEGAFEAGEEYWTAFAQSATWILEIDAETKTREVRFAFGPTRKGKESYPDARSGSVTRSYADAREGPSFQSRIFVREGRWQLKQARGWVRKASGIRVYVEGFRVLPYGEPRNDWLSLDYAYTRRSPGAWEELGVDGEDGDVGSPLTILPNQNFVGGVFIAQSAEGPLKTLVNREGFVPDHAYDVMVQTLRTGVSLALRARAAGTQQERAERRAARRKEHPNDITPSLALSSAVDRATTLVGQARRLAATGDLKGAAEVIERTHTTLKELRDTSADVISETALIRVLASVGTQMAAFVHEMNALVGMTESIDHALQRIREDVALPPADRRELAKLHSAIVDLRRGLELQAAYLVDVATVDARRRRSRQRFSLRFDTAVRLVGATAERRSISIKNGIPPDLRSPSMFPAELAVVFSNLLSNAIKAAGSRGQIAASGRAYADGTTRVRIQNTGRRVNPVTSERWFRPFESTTTQVDPVLGQGMGMGLPITRSILEEYGAEIKFVEPQPQYATAIEIVFH